MYKIFVFAIVAISWLEEEFLFEANVYDKGLPK